MNLVLVTMTLAMIDIIYIHFKLSIVNLLLANNCLRRVLIKYIIMFLNTFIIIINLYISNMLSKLKIIMHSKFVPAFYHQSQLSFLQLQNNH